jgi:hypothetical protein
MRYAIEALEKNGNWSRDAAGRDVPLYESREAAEADAVGIAQALGCDASEFRVVEIDA